MNYEQTRHTLQDIRNWPGAYASLSNRQHKDTAVIFVHGFMGDPVETWTFFQIYLDDDVHAVYDWWQNADLYFYKYNSTQWSVTEQAKRLLQFITGIFPKPSQDAIVPIHDVLGAYIKEKLGPMASFDATCHPALQYRRLVLVGHSLGAVLIREAILIEAAEYEYQRTHVGIPTDPSYAVLTADVRLFAPAIFGVSPSRILGLLYHVLFSMPKVKDWLAPALKSQVIIRQVREDSGKIKRMREQTERLTLAYDHKALRADIVFGGKESLVERDIYLYDRLADTLPEDDHWSVCKPTHEFRQPLTFVAHGATPAVHGATP